MKKIFQIDRLTKKIKLEKKKNKKIIHCHGVFDLVHVGHIKHFQEAKRIGIPVVGVVDTNCDPADADYVIPSNDDAVRAVKLCIEKIANACFQGKHIYSEKIKSGDFIQDKEEENDVLVERKAFVFKRDTNENEEESVVYSEEDTAIKEK